MEQFPKVVKAAPIHRHTKPDSQQVAQIQELIYLSFAFNNSRDQTLPKCVSAVSVDSGVTLGLHGSTYK